MKDIIFICAGGTGGHMFPALALAHDLQSRGLSVVFVTDDRGLPFTEKATGLSLAVEVISASTIPGGLIGKIRAGLKLARGYLQSRRLIARYTPRIVVGFGGYPSLPPLHMAQMRDIPTVIHEQNAVLGRANAFLAPKADRIALSLPDLRSLEEADAVRAVVTGNPVRSDIAALYSTPYNIPDDAGPFRILVMGGSLGAAVMGAVVPEALARLSPELRARIVVTQQARPDDLDRVKAAYEAAGITADIRPFIDNVAECLRTAHLVVARSGASTVAEVAIAGVPAIYVPYPHHADKQQRINAESVASRGGAWMMEEGTGFTATALAARVESLMLSPENLFNAAESARACARPEAARKLGNLVVALMKGWDKSAARPFDYTQGLKDE